MPGELSDKIEYSVPLHPFEPLLLDVHQIGLQHQTWEGA